MKVFNLVTIVFLLICFMVYSCKSEYSDKQFMIYDKSNISNSEQFTEYAQLLNFRHSLLLKGEYKPLNYSKAMLNCYSSKSKIEYLNCLEEHNSIFLVIYKLDERLDELQSVIDEIFPSFSDLDKYERYELLQSYEGAISTEEALLIMKQSKIK